MFRSLKRLAANASVIGIPKRCGGREHWAPAIAAVTLLVGGTATTFAKEEEVQPTRLGVIGGSSFLNSRYFADMERLTIATAYGPVVVQANQARTVLFIQRHGADPAHSYCPPHLIPKKAIISALHALGCSHIVGFGSVGSMKPSLPLGSLVVPHDYLNPWNLISFSEHSKSGHFIPGLDTALRVRLLDCLHQQDALVPTGVYVQTHGPRFETAAEIAFLAGHSDVVGMTCAHEATLSKEIGIPYALVCMCDNFANGVNSKELSVDEFHAGLKRNEAVMEQVLGKVLAALSPH